MRQRENDQIRRDPEALYERPGDVTRGAQQ